MTKTKINEQFGYKSLYPIPKQEELDRYYKEKYYEDLLKRASTQEAKLLNEDNLEDNKEYNWYRNTYYKDAKEIIESFIHRKGEIIDIGCGDGRFLSYMKKSGWKCKGVEPATIAYESAVNRGIDVVNCMAEDILKKEEKLKGNFDVANITGLLELVSNPVDIVKLCNKLLKENGLLRLHEINDFNVFHVVAVENLGIKEFWISQPDHINYFDKDSLTKILKYCGFEIKYMMGDFPMEMFLLMNYNYVEKKELGSRCHEARVAFESNISDKVRRKLYETLANEGIGRNIIFYAQKVREVE